MAILVANPAVAGGLRLGLGRLQLHLFNPKNGSDPRPWIPRLFLRMTLKLRTSLKLSSDGVTIKKKNKDGKVTVQLVYL